MSTETGMTGNFRVRKGWLGKSVLQAEVRRYDYTYSRYRIEWEDCPFYAAPAHMVKAKI